jgi:thioester reductase-like protein
VSIGKVLLEKVLRTFDDVKAVYIGIRVTESNKDAYDRYKKEIKDSTIFDELKTKLGHKRWSKFMKNKVKLLPMDITLPNLGLGKKQYEDLAQKLNIIVNPAGTVDFNMRLDLQADVNVKGALQLIDLALACPNFECFCHVSTLYALSDRTGFIDETVFDSNHNWLAEYD